MNEKPNFNDQALKREGVMYNRDLHVFVRREDFERLRRDYRYAVAEGFDTIVFKDKEVPVSTAAEMVAFLEAFFSQI